MGCGATRITPLRAQESDFHRVLVRDSERKSSWRPEKTQADSRSLQSLRSDRSTRSTSRTRSTASSRGFSSLNEAWQSTRDCGSTFRESTTSQREKPGRPPGETRSVEPKTVEPTLIDGEDLVDLDNDEQLEAFKSWDLRCSDPRHIHEYLGKLNRYRDKAVLSAEECGSRNVLATVDSR
eukprot:Skav222478  [mRNA]  locus=scaffold242:234435:248117:+ [translate_table: standard]